MAQAAITRRVLRNLRRPYYLLRDDPADGLRRIALHPYYWLKHLPDRRRYRRAHAQRLAADRAFDQRFGVDTAAEVAITDIDAPVESWAHATHYTALAEHDFDHAISFVRDDVSAYTFVDIGCGKGKAAMLAARRPFARVVGVEYAPELAAVALRNITRFRETCDDIRAGEIIIECADARTYELPAAPLVLMLVNPFDHVIMEPFTRALAAWYERGHHPLWVIYILPHQRALFDALPFLELAHIEDGLAVYRTPAS